jgi:hypothetical protein
LERIIEWQCVFTDKGKRIWGRGNGMEGREK